MAQATGTHPVPPPAEDFTRFGGVSRILAAGFGATTLMWLFSYLAILIPGAIVGEFLFGLRSVACRRRAGFRPR